MLALLSMQATKELCFLCYEALENAVKHTKHDIVARNVIKPGKQEKCPMFVTWKTSNDDLRGCIGIFKPINLYDGLQEYAVIAGTQDYRFSPVKPSEIPHLNCGISLLHSFEEAANALDWEVGKHGIRLFIDGHSSTFLPEVAKEQEWDKMETLIHLARKGGFSGKYDKAALERSTVERYQSAKCTATYEEYQEYIRTHH